MARLRAPCPAPYPGASATSTESAAGERPLDTTPTAQTNARSAPPFPLKELINARQGEQVELLAKYMNPRFAKVLKTIGFDRKIVRGAGSYLWDEQGRRYIDMLAGYGMFNIGRNHPVMKQAIRDYLELDDPIKLQLGAGLLPGLLAEKLLQEVPHLDKVFFANSGTESVEAALKFSRASTRRERVIHCQRAFHGLTYGSLSLNGCSSFRDGFMSLLPGTVSIPFGDLDALERELKLEKTAAFVVEPIQGKGVYVGSDAFLLGAQELCRKHGAKLVLDEIQTGMGRTGKLFAHQHIAGLEPDIVLVSKSLSGGYVPVGAVLYRDDVYDQVFSTLDRSVVHSSTFGGAGLAMTCGLATFHILEQEELIGNAAAQGEKLLSALQALVPEFEMLEEVRGRGLMVGIQFGKPTSLRFRADWNLIHAADASLFAQAFVMPLMDNHGILTQVAGHKVDIIKLIPPLGLTDDDIAWFTDAFRQVLDSCHRFPGPVWEVAKKLVRFATSASR
jgi:ornithine--oxo-acid transaminase